MKFVMQPTLHFHGSYGFKKPNLHTNELIQRFFVRRAPQRLHNDPGMLRNVISGVIHWLDEGLICAWNSMENIFSIYCNNY
jgi:hypothetical protein